MFGLPRKTASFPLLLFNTKPEVFPTVLKSGVCETGDALLGGNCALMACHARDDVSGAQCQCDDLVVHKGDPETLAEHVKRTCQLCCDPL